MLTFNLIFIQETLVPLMFAGDAKFIISCIRFAICCMNKINETPDTALLFNLFSCVYTFLPRTLPPGADVEEDVSKLAFSLLLSPICNV